MRRFLVLIGILFLNGCLVRTYTLEKPRVDRDFEGNQGYLMGTPKAGQTSKNPRLDEKRRISVMEVELGPKSSQEITVSPRTSEVSSTSVIQEEIDRVKEPAVVKKTATPVKATKYESYTVQKGDTLQKISQNFYGTTKKWYSIYQENKDVLKSPDKIYPGLTIRIPLSEDRPQEYK